MSVRSSEPAGVAWRYRGASPMRSRHAAPGATLTASRGIGLLSGPSRATRVRGDEWLPREVTGN